MRSLLVVAQVALALVLLASAGLALQSFDRLRRLPLGFDPHGILTLSISLPDLKYGPEKIILFYDALVERVGALPGVVAAATGVNVPFDDNEWDSNIHITGTPPDRPGEEPSAEFNYISPDYFRVMGMPILRGRGIERADVAGREKVSVVDESFVRRFSPAAIPSANTSTTRRRCKRTRRRSRSSAWWRAPATAVPLSPSFSTR